MASRKFFNEINVDTTKEWKKKRKKGKRKENRSEGIRNGLPATRPRSPFLIRFSRRTRPCYHTTVETSRHDSFCSSLPSLFIYIYYFFVRANNRLTLRFPRYNIFAGDAEFLKIAKPCHSFAARLPRHANILRHRGEKQLALLSVRPSSNEKSAEIVLRSFFWICMRSTTCLDASRQVCQSWCVLFLFLSFSFWGDIIWGSNEKCVKWIFSYFFFFFLQYGIERNITEEEGGGEVKVKWHLSLF